jgi:2-hydroxy-6-oxonona-2,4-dienedioate hydrolase
MPFMLAVMIFAARWIARRFTLPPAAGFVALVLVLITEFAVVLPLRGMSIAEYFATLDPVTGSVYYAMLGFYALLPTLLQSTRWYSRHVAAIGIVALLAVFLGALYLGYVADLESAYKRVGTGSEIAQTPCGPVEYAALGNGPAVLMVHGAGGGFDQGLEFASPLAQQGYRVIAVSRFGYLRTPLPADASPEAQADAHACLLDALKIERAAIVGLSAGAPSSLQFALRHPARAQALALLVPLAYAPWSNVPPAPPSAVARFMYVRAVKFDFLYWLVMRLAPGVVVKTILGTPPQVLAQASADEKQRVQRLMEEIMPLSRRQAGLLNDAAVAQNLGPYELERIATRTLAVSVADDLYGTYGSARYTAARIPGARFIGYSSGGHMAVGHHRAVLSELSAFLSGPDASLARR